MCFWTLNYIWNNKSLWLIVYYQMWIASFIVVVFIEYSITRLYNYKQMIMWNSSNMFGKLESKIYSCYYYVISMVFIIFTHVLKENIKFLMSGKYFVCWKTLGVCNFRVTYLNFWYAYSTLMEEESNAFDISKSLIALNFVAFQNSSFWTIKSPLILRSGFEISIEFSRWKNEKEYFQPEKLSWNSNREIFLN